MDLTRFSESEDITLYRAHGCEHCSDTGFTGRIGIYEFLRMSDSIRNLVLKKVDSTGLHKAAREEGLVTMSEDGIRKAMAGITTIEEVLRVTRQY
jgi:general secretion pathway protein E